MPIKPLDLELMTVIKAIEAAGGHAGISPNAPDFIKREFLNSILDCPDCRQAVLGKNDGCGN